MPALTPPLASPARLVAQEGHAEGVQLPRQLLLRRLQRGQAGAHIARAPALRARKALLQHVGLPRRRAAQRACG